MKYRIPFNKPFIIGKELYYIAQSVSNGHIAGNGLFTKKCQALMEEKFRTKKVFLTTSCTAALEMAAMLCDIHAGDEIILPSYTFVSTANAFYKLGVKLVFVDIHPDTLNIDEQNVEQSITDRSKVIIPVHYAGISCNMDLIMTISRKYHLLVVEDAAQAVNAKYKHKHLGTFGDFGTFSFHETKNLICGEGGALIVNNAAFIERAEIIWEKGTNRSKFFRGEVDKYTWVDIGSSYLPSEIVAAYLYAQLEKMEEITKRRQEIFQIYDEGLTPLADKGLLKLPTILNESQPNYHLFYILLENEPTRNKLINYLKGKGIHAVFHYVPLHLSPVGQSLGYKAGQLPVTESISSRLLRLPFYYDLKPGEQEEIIDLIGQFFVGQKRKFEKHIIRPINYEGVPCGRLCEA